MQIETSIAVIALAFVVLVIVLIATLVKTQAALDSAKRDLHQLSSEAVQLTQKLDALTADIKSKSESLNFMFRPLRNLSKERPRRDACETVEEVVELVTVSLQLFQKIKTAVRHYAK